MTESQSVVYFVEIDKRIKIGVTRNLAGRLGTFRSSSVNVQTLLVVPGDRSLEQRLHKLLAESRINREIFRREYRVLNFIRNVEFHGLEQALIDLEETTPEARERDKENERLRRVRAARQSKADKDAHFAALVAKRKERLGW